MPLSPPMGCLSRTRTMRFDSGYGKGLSRTPFTKLNIAVFAPIASAMVAIATARDPGCCEAGELRNGGPAVRLKGRTCETLRQESFDKTHNEHDVLGPREE